MWEETKPLPMSQGDGNFDSRRRLPLRLLRQPPTNFHDGRWVNVDTNRNHIITPDTVHVRTGPAPTFTAQAPAKRVGVRHA